jgi:hypothetical protein
MSLTTEEKPRDLKKLARRVTTGEMIERGFSAFESAGLDREQVEDIAQDVGLEGEDMAFSVATAPSCRGSHEHSRSQQEPPAETMLSAIDLKIDEIRQLVLEQRDSSLRKDWYSVTEVARLTGYQPYTIRQCCNTGRIGDDWKAKDLRTGKWRISVDAVRSIQNHGLPPAS